MYVTHRMRSPTCLLESRPREKGDKRNSGSEPGQLQTNLERPGPDPAGRSVCLFCLRAWLILLLLVVVSNTMIVNSIIMISALSVRILRMCVYMCCIVCMLRISVYLFACLLCLYFVTVVSCLLLCMVRISARVTSKREGRQAELRFGALSTPNKLGARQRWS